MSARARVVVEPRQDAPSEALADTGPTLGDFPLSAREAEWSGAAEASWLEACRQDDGTDWDRYLTGFLLRDPETPESSRLLIVDVQDGEPVVVWKAILNAAARVARGDHPDALAVREQLDPYFEKARVAYDDLEIRAPWATPDEEAPDVRQIRELSISSPDGAPITVTIRDGAISASSSTADGDVQLAPELQPQETRPERTPTADPPADGDAPAPARASQVRWEAILAPEGRMTDDGRIFAPGSISWRELPLTLMAMVETQDGHMGAELAGRIDRIWRDEQGLIRGAGVFDDGDYGAEIARLVGDRTLTGNSVDLAIREYEVGARSDFVDADGYWLGDDARSADDDDAEPADLLEILFAEDEEPPIFVVRDAVIGMSTVCPFPAFADATISLVAAGHEFTIDSGGLPLRWTIWIKDGVDVSEGLTAAAAGLAPVVPPATWFEDPELEELTPLTITDDGRIYGHAAAWETCHIGLPGCTVAPTSECDYAYFLLKEVVCDDGTRVPCGTVTLDAPHADRTLGRQDATAHYDDTGCAAADITVGEDEHGIWFAGAMRPDVDAAKARKLQGAALSGDWRRVNGNLELVALLAVNVPGFPVPRARALVAAADDGIAEVLSLTAAGIHDGRTVSDLTDEQRARLAALAARARDGFAGLAALATRVAA